jgi:hypothetical protein
MTKLKLIELALSLLCSCAPVTSEPEGRLVDASIDSQLDAARSQPDATLACEQLAPGDDPRCADACMGSAVDLGSDHCFALSCALLDGTTWTFGACKDPL